MCEMCKGKKYLVCQCENGLFAVQRCDVCWEGNNFYDDKDAAELAKADGINCLPEYPCYIIGSLEGYSTTPNASQTYDRVIEEIWLDLEDIPVNNNDKLDSDYFIWEKGADKHEDVWRWFDNNHSKGVGYLTNDFIPPYNKASNRTNNKINEFDNPHQQTENFKKHRKVMQDFSVADVVKTYDCINNLVLRFTSDMDVDVDVDMDERIKSLNDIDHIREPLIKIINSLTTDYKCSECNGWLYCSDLPQYDYVCPNCDENF